MKKNDFYMKEKRMPTSTGRNLLSLHMITFFCILCLGCTSTAYTGDPPKSTSSLLTLEEIKQSTKTETDAAVAFVSKAVQYASVENFGYELTPETKKLMGFVFDTAKHIGFSARQAAGGLAGVLEYGTGKEVVGVLIHLDVVPVSEQETPEWKQPPFSGNVVDGHIWGRGSQDDKGALGAVLWGAKILIDHDLPFKRRLRIILGTKEEKSFESLTRYFAEEAQPDFGIVPDGVYVMQGEKGIADMDFTFPGLSADATATQRDTVVHWAGGTVINTVPDFSYVVIKSNDVKATRTEILTLIKKVTAELQSGKSTQFYGVTQPYEAHIDVQDYPSFVSRYQLEGVPQGDLVVFSQGVASHGSTPWDGKNAIVEVALVGSVMSQLADNAYQRAFQFVAAKIGLSLDGSGLGIPYIPPAQLPPAPAGITPVAYYGTSANLGVVTVHPNADTLVLSIDFRTGLENKNQQLMQHATEAVEPFHGSAAFQAGVGSHYEPFYYPVTDPLLTLVTTCYKEVNGGRDPYLIISSGTTYMKLVSNFISFGPVDLYPDPSVDRYHAKNERISIQSLTDNVTLYAYTLQKLIQAETAPLRK